MANEKHYCPTAFLILFVSSAICIFFSFLGVSNLIAARGETFETAVRMLYNQSYMYFSFAGFSLIIGLSAFFVCYFTTKSIKEQRQLHVNKTTK